jgi:tRNA (guanine-N7-)-methyltransferase
MASIASSTNNPINQEYLEYFEHIKSSFKQCTYYMKRKKKCCTRRVNDFNTNFCSLHTPEGLARERAKGKQTRKIYNNVVDTVCKDYLDQLLNLVSAQYSDIQQMMELYNIKLKKENSDKKKDKNNSRGKRVSAPNRMVNPLSLFYNIPFDTTTNWKRIFPSEKRLIHIDVGCARGEFVFRLAEEHKFNNYYFIGCEIRKDLVVAANEKKEKRKMSNLHFIPGNFSTLVVDILASLRMNGLEISSISIQFPDPWRRKKFKKRLIVQDKFIETLAKVLQSNTLIYFSSDVEQVYEHMYNEFLSNKSFQLKDVNETNYQFHKIPTERTLVCEQTFRKIWSSVAIRT